MLATALTTVHKGASHTDLSRGHGYSGMYAYQDASLAPLSTYVVTDPRVQVLPLDGFIWSTYHELEGLGVLNESLKVPWDQGGTSVVF